jgi:2,3-bisphosphoglycerate-independent phosphoglycerate mutase
MRYAIILPDGAADEPLDELDGMTPLEAANTPHLDWISTNGRQGTVVTVPKGYLPGSDVATLSVVGYDPNEYYTGRAPLEAVAQKLKVGRDDLVFRCNLVTIVDGRMEDFTAGHIGQAEAERVIAELNDKLGDETLTFYPGVSYRHLMVLRDAGSFAKLKTTPPHDIPDAEVADHLPRGKGKDRIIDLMSRSQDLLADHDVNQVRRDLGENPVTSIWLWGQGLRPRLPGFEKRFGVRGATIAAVDLIRGIALSIGWPLIDVEGATGYTDTNYAGKGAAAVAALDEYDLVVTHIEAPDEAGHEGDAAGKVKAIERVDEHVIGPVLERLRREDDWRILIAPDHPTPVAKRVHTTDPPPFCMAGRDVVSVLKRPFSEANGRQSDLHIDPGHELMEYFLKR